MQKLIIVIAGSSRSSVLRSQVVPTKTKVLAGASQAAFQTGEQITQILGVPFSTIPALGNEPTNGIILREALHYVKGSGSEVDVLIVIAHLTGAIRLTRAFLSQSGKLGNLPIFISDGVYSINVQTGKVEVL